jgi:hypothetical protein
MSSTTGIFKNTKNLQEAIDMLQIGIQEEDRLSVTVDEFHPDLQLIFKTMGMEEDTVVLTSVLTPRGTFYVSGPAIGKVAFKANEKEVLVLQTPGFFMPLAKVREAFGSDDQSWAEHTLVIDLENGATAQAPIYTTFKTKEERDAVKAGPLIRGDLSAVKSVYFSYVQTEPAEFEPTTVEGVLALSNGRFGLGFVKVGSPFTLLKEVPNGTYRVIGVFQEKAVRKSDGNAFLSKKMLLLSEDNKTIETGAVRPISQVVRDAMPSVTADDSKWFYKIQLVDGKIAATERDITQLSKSLATKIED